jgi:hypothetical protein
VVSHVGARLLCDLADELDLTDGLSAAMAPPKKRRRGHDRGRVLVDLTVSVAYGGTTFSDLRTLLSQPQLFGQVASVSTTWRTLEAIDDAALARIATARAAARQQAWAQGMDPGFYVIDIDGTLVTSDSEFKQGRRPPIRRVSGFTRCCPTWTPPESPWPACCGPVTPAVAPPRTTSWCSTRP